MLSRRGDVILPKLVGSMTVRTKDTIERIAGSAFRLAVGLRT
jgi:hypothetical protein